MIDYNMRGKKAVIDTEKNAPMRIQRNTLMNCISGDWKKIATENNADYTVTEKGANKVVTLTAKKAATRGYSKIVITYRKSDNLPVELVFEEFNGTVTTYKMSNIVKK
jgi:outer membrane lipoprotein-sorting protein